MTPSKPAVWTSVVALLSLGLAGCSSEAGVTGWIPRDGAIAGVITVSGAASPALSAASSMTPHTIGRDRRSLPVPSVAALLPAARGRVPSIRHAPPRARGTIAPHDLIVTFRNTAFGAPPVGAVARGAPADVRALHGAIRSHLAAMVPGGATVVGVSPAIFAARLHLADTTQREAIAAVLRRDPAVAAVTPNGLIWLDDRVRRVEGVVSAAASGRTPNDGLYPIQSWHYGLIDLPRAWSITTGNASVLVALVDDGMRFDHPDVAANLTSDGYDFVSDTDTLPLCAGGKITNDDDGDSTYDADPTIPASYSLDSTGTCFVPDTLGAHGLHVAGTIGAVGNNGLGVTGVNWTVRIRPVRAIGVAGFGTFYDIAQGILYAAGLPADNGKGGTVQAASGAKVINLSLGGTSNDTTLHNAIISATSAGALVVAAAGNFGSSGPFYPAGYPEVLAVAAVGPDGAPTVFSNFGSYVGIRAPGGNFALGDATDGVLSTSWAFFPIPTPNGTIPAGPVYAFAEGTSMAAPHVSGVAALVLAQSPGLTPAALRSRLTSYAVGPATLYGAGLVNAYNSLAQRHGPPTQTFARLYSATTGTAVMTVPTQGRGRFVFNDVPYGRYFLYGGDDENADQQVGLPGRSWGAFGSAAFPESLTVLGPGPYAVSFGIGLPNQVQPNQTQAAANVLVVGGYVQAQLLDTAAFDWYRVNIPAAGTYTFETSGWVGACGFALDEGTAIRLFDSKNQTQLDSAFSIDFSRLNFCSRLTRSLGPGAYYVAVQGAFPNGRYRLQARTGS